MFSSFRTVYDLRSVEISIEPDQSYQSIAAGSRSKRKLVEKDVVWSKIFLGRIFIWGRGPMNLCNDDINSRLVILVIYGKFWRIFLTTKKEFLGKYQFGVASAITSEMFNNHWFTFSGNEHQFKILEREKYVDGVRIFLQIPIQYEVADVLEGVVRELIRNSTPLSGGFLGSKICQDMSPLTHSWRVDPFRMKTRVE